MGLTALPPGAPQVERRGRRGSWQGLQMQLRESWKTKALLVELAKKRT